MKKVLIVIGVLVLAKSMILAGVVWWCSRTSNHGMLRRLETFQLLLDMPPCRRQLCRVYAQFAAEETWC